MSQRHRYSTKEKKGHVRACLEGIEQGGSISSYVAAHWVSRSSMNSWMKEFRQPINNMDSPRETKVSLVQIDHVRRDPPQQTGPLKVHMNNLCVELPVGNSDADLKRVLLTLKEVL